MPRAVPHRQREGHGHPALKLMRERLPDITLVVDAGLGAPSTLPTPSNSATTPAPRNTAIAKAADPVAMANAFSALGVEAAAPLMKQA